MRSFTVYYRTGGTENFKWQRVAERYSTTWEGQDAAIAKCEELRKAGYPARYEYTDLLDSIGLPETFAGGLVQ